jgi:hypothetical protein
MVSKLDKLPKPADNVVAKQGAEPTAWRDVSIPMPNIEPIIKKLQSFIDTLKTTIQLVVGLIEMILAFISAIADPLAALIRALLEQYLEGAGIFAIYIPFGKRMLFNTPSHVYDLSPTSSQTFSKPMVNGGESEKTSTSLYTTENSLNGKGLSQAQKTFMFKANQCSGGNAGFYRTVVDSLSDSRDHCRPQFNGPKDYVAGGVMILGSDFDPFSFIDGLFVFAGIFGELFAMSGGLPDLPKPKNLRAETVFGTGTEMQPVHGAKGKFKALLMWDIIDVPFHTIPDLGGVIVVPTETAVIAVKNNLKLSNSSNVMQLFGTRDLYAGMESPDGSAKVIHVRGFRPNETMFLTDVMDTARDDIWTFFLAYKLKGYNKTDNFSKAKGNELGYYYLSNAARLIPMQMATSGTPPDWVRTPSVADLLPPLAGFIRQLVVFIEMLASYLPSILEHLKKYIDFIRSEIQRYERIILRLLDQIKKLLEMLKIGTLGGLYCKSFFGQGGNQFFINDLAASLAEGYPNAPPFHNGDEFVTGLVVMAGGAYPEVAAAKPLLDLIFGSDSGINAQKDDLLDSIGAQVTAIQAEWGDDPVAPKADTLQGLTLCFRPPPPTITFAEDLSPKGPAAI